MKKILILNGAGRKNGKTAAMIKSFSDAASANGNEIKEFHLQNMNIHGCLNCNGCQRKPEYSEEPCVQKDDMNEIYPALREADMVVFASPVYFWDITGPLKTAIDRTYAFFNNAHIIPDYRQSKIPPKKFALLLTSGGSTEEHMAEWSKGFEKWMHWENIGVAMNDAEKAKAIGQSL